MTGAIVQRSESYLFPVTGQPVRTVTIDGEPWFVGRDVAEVLGYANTSKALKDHVPAGHRKGNGAFPLAELGFHPQTVMIDEPGMYRLVLRANTDLAERFQEWVTAEVLPAIRKTGSYAVAAKLSRRDLAQLIIEEADRADQAEKRVAELEPAAEAWEELASAKGDYSLREASLILDRVPGINTGQIILMQYLRDEQMVDHRGIPYAQYRKYLVQRAVWYTNRKTGDRVAATQIRITADGLPYLRKRLGRRNQVAAGQLVLVPGAAS